MKLTKWLKPLLPDGGREDVKYLILWTFPGQVTLEANHRGHPDKPIYYCDLNNNFWYIIEMVFGKNSKEESDIFRKHYESMKKAIEMIQKLQKLQKNRVTHDSYLEIICDELEDELEKVYDYEKKICTMYRIALRDRVDECYLSDSSEDAKRLPKTYNTYSECIEKIESGDITVLLNWKSKGEKLNRKRASEYRKISEKYRKISEEYRKISEEYRKISEEYRDDLTKWMNYCVIDSLLSKKSTVPKQFTVPKQSTSSSNPKWIREILDNWKKNLK